MKDCPIAPPEVSEAMTRAEQPALTAQRELARVTALLVGVCQMIENPDQVEWPEGLWSWYEAWKAEHIEH